MKKLLPLILALVGIGGGVGAGLALRPDPPEMTEEHGTQEDHASKKADKDHAKADEHADDHDDGHGPVDAIEFVKLNNQFVIPIVARDMVESLVVMSLSIELEAGNTETVYRREPKLRDEFLQVLFDHANMGGFRGEFTDTAKLGVLRAGLLEVAQGVLGSAVTGVLITDLARQDM